MSMAEDERTAAAFLKVMRSQTDPRETASQPRVVPYHPAADRLRALMAQAATHIAEVSLLRAVSTKLVQKS